MKEIHCYNGYFSLSFSGVNTLYALFHTHFAFFPKKNSLTYYSKWILIKSWLFHRGLIRTTQPPKLSCNIKMREKWMNSKKQKLLRTFCSWTESHTQKKNPKKCCNISTLLHERILSEKIHNLFYYYSSHQLSTGDIFHLWSNWWDCMWVRYSRIKNFRS